MHGRKPEASKPSRQRRGGDRQLSRCRCMHMHACIHPCMHALTRTGKCLLSSACTLREFGALGASSCWAASIVCLVQPFMQRRCLHVGLHACMRRRMQLKPHECMRPAFASFLARPGHWLERCMHACVACMHAAVEAWEALCFACSLSSFPSCRRQLPCMRACILVHQQPSV